MANVTVLEGMSGDLHNRISNITDLTGQYEDRSFVVTRGDSRLGMTIAKNEHTEKMKRGLRFLIDDPKSETLLAYELTKPFKLSGVYNEKGVFRKFFGTRLFCYISHSIGTIHQRPLYIIHLTPQLSEYLPNLKAYVSHPEEFICLPLQRN
jgi:hypothetical protein